jgi:hypothetical protein
MLLREALGALFGLDFIKNNNNNNNNKKTLGTWL